MPEKTTATPLVDYLINLQHKKPTKLDAINQMIDWRPVAKTLDKALKRGTNAVGKPAYPALPFGATEDVQSQRRGAGRSNLR